jgi:hypothetical protein
MFNHQHLPCLHLGPQLLQQILVVGEANDEIDPAEDIIIQS